MSERTPLIFIIEDEKDIRETLQEALEVYGGFNVRLASDGREALAVSFERSPDVILLDIMMPNMDGSQFLVHRTSAPHLAGVPVIVITADGRVDEKIKGLGVSGILKKPVSLDNLLETVEKFCGGRAVSGLGDR